MGEQEAILAAIAAKPEDDTPRLAYADWLDEHEQPERAELIRCQISLASGNDVASNTDLTADPALEAKLAARKRELLGAHRVEWNRSLHDLGATEVAWSRGFPEGISIPAERFLANAEQIFIAAPTMASLTLSSNDIGPAGAQVLAESPHLAHLTSLTLRSNGIRRAGAQALARSPHLSHLTSLDLGNNGIGPSGAQALASSPHLAHLTSLDLRINRIGDAGAQALAQSPHLAHLTSLNLLSNYIGPAGAGAGGEPAPG